MKRNVFIAFCLTIAFLISTFFIEDRDRSPAIDSVNQSPVSSNSESIRVEFPRITFDDLNSSNSIDKVPESIRANIANPSVDLYYNPRAVELGVSRYDEFVLNLEIDESEKQNIRQILFNAIALNSELVNLWEIGELSQDDLALAVVSLEEELSTILQPNQFDAFLQFESQRRQERSRTNRDQREQLNMWRISGLTVENQEIFVEALTEEANRRVRFRSPTMPYTPETLDIVRGQLSGQFAPDQLEVVDAYIASELEKWERRNQ